MGNSSQADLLLSLGSSLVVSSHIVEETVNHGGTLVICNLQRTPLSKHCSFQIFGETDTVMAMLAEQLEIGIPRFRLLRRVIMGVTKNRKEVFLKTVDFHDPTSELGCLCAVDWDSTGRRVQVIGKGKSAETAAANGTHTSPIAGMDLAKLSPLLYFMGHYSEPPCALSVDLSLAGAASVSDIRLAYDPSEAAWAVVSQEMVPKDFAVARGYDISYGKYHWRYCVNAMMEHHRCDEKSAQARVKQRKEEGFCKAREKGLMPSSTKATVRSSSLSKSQASGCGAPSTGRPKRSPRPKSAPRHAR